jgi:hypothetical protein
MRLMMSKKELERAEGQSLVEVTRIEEISQDEPYVMPIYVGDLKAPFARRYMDKAVNILRGDTGFRYKGVFFTMVRGHPDPVQPFPCILMEQAGKPTYVVWVRRGFHRNMKFEAEALKLKNLLKQIIYAD